MQDGRAAHDSLVTFWQRLFLAPLPSEMLSTFVAMNVPEPPADPTPVHVVAYVELVTLVENRSLTRRLVARTSPARS